MSIVPRELPPAPGIRLVDGGGCLRVYAGAASRVRAIVGEGSRSRRVDLDGPEQGGWWTGFLPGLAPGDRYAVHADGAFAPERGHRYAAYVPLLDPYARAVDTRGRAVVVAERFDWGQDAPPRVPWPDCVVYETHVRGLTMRHPDVPVHQRGTYAGLAHPAVLDHLQRIGVTTIQLLPIHTFLSEPALLQRGLVNYWGYNSLGFFAPHARYAASTDPQSVVDEVKAMVKAVHDAGLEVVLDVVYNHTAEHGGDGPTYSFRGLDNSAYYRLDGFGRDLDVTGCGNTLDTRHPVACQLVLDSLRYWVTQMHVDGFRFDLAVALARDKFGDYDPDHPFLMALRTDPVLSAVKLIAEPWDIGGGGWRTGQFPPPFAEWNDRFRDDVRTFWLTDQAAQHGGRQAHGARDLATRMAGSQDLFFRDHRAPSASINFVAAHDGFTTHDLTAYDHRHNEGNGEGNRDGASHNRSWNHTIEGPSDDAEVLERRRRSILNLLGTLMLSAGVPMINGGDEFGRTQDGNNNAYCQDNEIGWLDWDWKPWQEDLVDHVATLARIRREHAVLRPRRFFTGAAVHEGGPGDVSWFGPDGAVLDGGRWSEQSTRTLCMLLGSPDADEPDVLLVVNGAITDVEVTLAHVPARRAYRLLWDSAAPAAPLGSGPLRPVGDRAPVTAMSVQVWASRL